MKDITSNEVEEMLRERPPLTIVFVQTPLCGTCKMAKRMLEVIGVSFDSLPMYSLNINHAPSFAQKWKIESVPCKKVWVLNVFTLLDHLNICMGC